jgi:DNA repair protein RadC
MARDERPRERFLRLGPSALSDAELLAISIGSGSRGRSAVDVGRDLLKQFGSLRALLTLCNRTTVMLPVTYAALKRKGRKISLQPPRPLDRD